MRVDPVPGVGVGAFWCVGVEIGPGGGEADGGVVVGGWGDDGGEGGGCEGVEEGFGHEADLIVDYVSREVWLVWRVGSRERWGCCLHTICVPGEDGAGG